MGRVLQYSFLPPFPAGPCQVKNGFAIFHVVRSFYSTIDSQNKRQTQTSKQKRKKMKTGKNMLSHFSIKLLMMVERNLRKQTYIMGK